MGVASVSCRKNTVKEVNASFNTFKNVFRCAYTHKICGLILRKIGNYLIKNVIHFFMGFAYCKSAYGIAVKVQLRYTLCMFYSYVVIYGSLVYTKKHLFFIYCIVKGIETVKLSLASVKPSCCTLDRILHIASVSKGRRAFVKSHCYGRSQI